MRTLEEYVAMIPTAPPDDIERYLDSLGRKPMAITSYRCISRDDAESRLDCEDFRADLRPSAAIRPAALWCSECESWYLAEYVPAYGTPCSPNLTYQNNSGVQVVNVEQDTLSMALDLVDAVLDRLEREGLDTTTERELLAQLWWDGAALADKRRSEEERND